MASTTIDPNAGRTSVGGSLLSSYSANSVPANPNANRVDISGKLLNAAPAASPTVISDSNIRKNVIPDIKTQASSMLPSQGDPYAFKPGETVDAYKARIASTYPQTQNTGSNPQSAPQNNTGGTSDYDNLYNSILGSTPQQDNFYDADLNLLQSMQASSDAKTSNSLAGISAQVQQKRSDLAAQQQAGNAQATMLLNRTGANRTGSGAQLISAEGRSYIRAASNIDLEEAQLTNAALAAQADNNFKLLGQTLNVLKDKRQEKLDVVNKLYDNMVAEKKQNQKDIQSVVLNAAQNGATPEVQASIAAAPDANSAIQAAGVYLQSASGQMGDYLQYKKDTVQKGLTPIDYATWKAQDDSRQAKLDSRKAYSSAYGAAKGKADAEAETSKNALIGSNSNPAIATALNTILGSGKFTADQTAQVTKAINSGEDPFTVIKNQAKNIMGQTEATKLTSYEAANSAMEDLKTDLKQYYDAGGKTSLLSGTMEKTINNLGEVNDPNLVGLATKVAVSLQSYRNAISGTAYSDQEGKDIASIFPGINNSKGLNDAIVNARLQANDSVIDGIYKTSLGDKTYNALKAVDATVQSTDDARAQVTTFVASPEAKMAITPDVNTKITSLTGGVTFETAGQLAIYMSSLPGAKPESVANVLKNLGYLK